MRRVLWIPMLLVLASPSARAEESGDSLIERGIRLRREHRDAEALDTFRHAYELAPSPRIRAQIALAEQALGQWANAETDLNDVLTSTDDDWIRAHAEVLTETLASIRHRLATLLVESNFPGAQLWVNGHLSGNLPILPMRIAAGDVDYEVRLAGHASIRRRITVAAESTVHEIVDFEATNLVEAPGAATARSSDRAPIGDSLGKDQRLPADTRDPLFPSNSPLSATTRTPDHSGARWMAWGALSGAGALLAGAVVAHVIHDRNAARYNDDARCLRNGVSRDDNCGVYRGRAETAGAVAITGYIGAGALALTSGVLFFVSRPKAIAESLRFFVGMNRGTLYGQCSATF